MSFEILALITTGAGTLLGLGFMFAGRFMLEQWGLDATDAALVMSRGVGRRCDARRGSRDFAWIRVPSWTARSTRDAEACVDMAEHQAGGTSQRVSDVSDSSHTVPPLAGTRSRTRRRTSAIQGASHLQSS